MSESGEPPRVRVTLPGGVVVPGWLLGWRQGPEGDWLPEVAVCVPATAVQRIPGEDYAKVPRVRARVDQRYVMATDTRTTPPGAELHLAECWEIREPPRWLRITPMIEGVAGPDLLRFPDTPACPVCLDPDTGAPR